jgi:hypothetical protein
MEKLKKINLYQFIDVRICLFTMIEAQKNNTLIANIGKLVPIFIKDLHVK